MVSQRAQQFLERGEEAVVQVSGIYEDGHITLLSPIHQKKAKVIVTVIEDESEQCASLESTWPSQRIPGLNKGTYFMTDDFDEPLPDSFWLGEE